MGKYFSLLSYKYLIHNKPLFEHPCSDDLIVIRYFEEFYNWMVANKPINVYVEKKQEKGIAKR